MSLADRLNEVRESYNNETQVCKLMSVTFNSGLSAVDVDALLKAINARAGDEHHMPNSRLAQALREEGFDVSPSAVDRHRRGSCACGRKVH